MLVEYPGAHASQAFVVGFLNSSTPQAAQMTARAQWQRRHGGEQKLCVALLCSAALLCMQHALCTCAYMLEIAVLLGRRAVDVQCHRLL